MPQPKISKVSIKADLFPFERDAYFDARIEMVNKTDQPIDSMHLVSTQLSSFSLLYQGDSLSYRFPLTYDSPKFQIFGTKKETEWYKIYKMPYTLMPGDTIVMQVKSSIENKGFANGGLSREVVYNGTFIGGGLPEIGYSTQSEISSDEKRREYDLPKKRL
jgi:ABC-2 type transport system permease protein